MDEEMGETRVKHDTISVAAHLRLIDQFLGFAGSSAESHVTYTCQSCLQQTFNFRVSYKIRVLDAAIALLLHQLWLRSLNVMLVRNTSPDLFVGRLLTVCRLILIFLLFRATRTAIVVAR